MRPSKVFTNPQDGSASVTLNGEMVKVSETNISAALATLLDEIAKLEERVGALEQKDRAARSGGTGRT